MKKIAYALIVTGLLLVINSLGHSIFDLWSKQDLVKQAQNKLEQEKKESAQLQKEIKIVQSQSFIEAQAHDKLFMVRPGESEIILPNKFVPSDGQLRNEPASENWQKWVNLFFPN